MKTVRMLKNGFISKGAEAMFIQTSNDRGLKLYKYEWEAESAHERQTKAHKVKVGPKVLSKVKKYKILAGVSKRYRDVYGYKTEVASVNKCMDCKGCNHLDGYKKKCKDRPVDLTYKQKLSLETKMDKIGLSTWDLHWGNIGKIGNRYVLIDFGDLTTT